LGVEVHEKGALAVAGQVYVKAKQLTPNHHAISAFTRLYQHGQDIPHARGQIAARGDLCDAGFDRRFNCLGHQDTVGAETDSVTGLMWQPSPDTNGDGQIEATD